ncbi:hypothetical protein CRG98_015155 [Punica granatum]|uniref:Uncharacterized protein n=1 Tax=Punica granatum TaxID=22663 RepID=A0A2I0K8B3_PUNGR|nr:hypothetical protein CRG98_015155 [Punica granatum]
MAGSSLTPMACPKAIPGRLGLVVSCWMNLAGVVVVSMHCGCLVAVMMVVNSGFGERRKGLWGDQCRDPAGRRNPIANIKTRESGLITATQ